MTKQQPSAPHPTEWASPWPVASVGAEVDRMLDDNDNMLQTIAAYQGILDVKSTLIMERRTLENLVALLRMFDVNAAALPVAETFATQDAPAVTTIADPSDSFNAFFDGSSAAGQSAWFETSLPPPPPPPATATATATDETFAAAAAAFANSSDSNLGFALWTPGPHRPQAGEARDADPLFSSLTLSPVRGPTSAAAPEGQRFVRAVIRHASGGGVPASAASPSTPTTPGGRAHRVHAPSARDLRRTYSAAAGAARLAASLQSLRAASQGGAGRASGSDSDAPTATPVQARPRGVVCDECAEPTTATHACADCAGQPLCDLHAEAHRRSRRTSAHVLRAVTAG